MSPPIDPTPISDYEHWNEEARQVWWEEVGKHAGDQNEPDPDDDWDYRTYDDPFDERDYQEEE